MRSCRSPVGPRPNLILTDLTRSLIFELLVIFKQEDKMKDIKSTAALKMRTSRAKKLAELSEDEIRAAKRKET